jgi:ABC-type transporter Mla MlaB component
MTGDGVNGDGAKKKAKRGTATKTDDVSDQLATIRCSRSGEWLPAAELRVAALSAVDTPEVTLDFAEVDHLEAGTLQILLALANQRRKKGLSLHWVNASAQLSQWLEYAGAPAHLSPKLTEPS